MPVEKPPTKRNEIIDYCYDILRKKGHRVEKYVETGVNGNSLKADLVTRTTVYEIREILAKTPLYAGTGQGLVYAWWLQRRRVVVVGYLPSGGTDLGDALVTIENIRRTCYVEISIIDQDPFWELVPISYRHLGYAALFVGVISLAVFAIPLLRDEVRCRIYPDPIPETCAIDRLYRP
jgi:hypothetical protein